MDWRWAAACVQRAGRGHIVSPRAQLLRCVPLRSSELSTRDTISKKLSFWQNTHFPSNYNTERYEDSCKKVGPGVMTNINPNSHNKLLWEIRILTYLVVKMPVGNRGVLMTVWAPLHLSEIVTLRGLVVTFVARRCGEMGKSQQVTKASTC